jgi:hypothetical protein
MIRRDQNIPSTTSMEVMRSDRDDSFARPPAATNEFVPS